MEYIIDEENIIDLEKEDLQSIIEDSNLGEFEFEKIYVKNILKIKDMLTELVSEDTNYIKDLPPRPRFEFQRGYKIARDRGAKLSEVKVFNLFYRFSNRKINANSMAVMYRPPNLNEEWIILLPDNTKHTILQETDVFLNQAGKYYLSSKIESNQLNRIEENLKLLFPAERCAQSIMHEYGHVLHWRMFDALGLESKTDQYLWFFEQGYADIIDRRVPSFSTLYDEDKLFYLTCIPEKLYQGNALNPYKH